MIPQGRYRARAIGGDLSVSSAKNTDQVEVDFELLDERYAGQTIKWIGFFTDKTTDRTMESLRICGWNTDDPTDLQGLTDNEVELVIEHETYEGEQRERVRWVNKIGGFRVGAPMDDVRKKAFAQRMKGAAIKSRAAAANGSGPPPRSDADFNFGANAKDDVGF